MALARFWAQESFISDTRLVDLGLGAASFTQPSNFAFILRRPLGVVETWPLW